MTQSNPNPNFLQGFIIGFPLIIILTMTSSLAEIVEVALGVNPFRAGSPLGLIFTFLICVLPLVIIFLLNAFLQGVKRFTEVNIKAWKIVVGLISGSFLAFIISALLSVLIGELLQPGIAQVASIERLVIRFISSLFILIAYIFIVRRL